MGLIPSLNYTKSLCLILYAKMSQHYHYTYCLQKQLTYFDLRVSANFGLEVSAQFWPKNSYKKNQQHSQSFLNSSNFLCIIFYAKLCRYSHYTHYLHTKQTTYNLTNPILCQYLPPNSYFFTYLMLFILP